MTNSPSIVPSREPRPRRPPWAPAEPEFVGEVHPVVPSEHGVSQRVVDTKSLLGASRS